MRMSRPAVSSSKTRVVVLTADAHFEQLVHQTFSVSPQVELSLHLATVAGAGDRIDLDGATVIVIDLDATRDDEMQALERLTIRTGGWPPVVVVTQDFDANVARRCCRCGSPTFWSSRSSRSNWFAPARAS